jgi:hypothetical protein
MPDVLQLALTGSAAGLREKTNYGFKRTLGENQKPSGLRA